MWIHLIVTVLLLVCKGQSRYENEKLEGVCGNCTCGYISKPFSKDPYFVKLIQSRGGLQNQSIDCVNKSLFAYPKFLTDNQSFIHVDLSHNPLYRSKDHENDWSEKWMICRVFPKLLSISLASTGLKKLGSIFKDCKDIDEIDLDGNQLENVEAAELPGTISRLTMETNLMEPDVFENKKIWKLNLTYHSEIFDDDFFKGSHRLNQLNLTLTVCKNLSHQLLNLSSLEFLSLRGYKVSLLSPSFFSKLDNLKSLSIDLPQLQQMSLESEHPSLKTLEIKNVKKMTELPALPALTKLLLEGIDHLPQKYLSQKSQTLKNLDVIDCSLVRIPKDWLSSLTSLEELNLSHNNLTSLNKDSFTHMGTLRYLNLANNMLTSVTLTLPQSLQLLVLRENSIKGLEANFLDGNNKVQTLDLEGNDIERVEAGAFTQLPQITSIYLQKNRIAKLGDNLFSDLPLLDSLDLSGNLLSEISDVFINSSIKSLILKGNSIKYLKHKVLCQMSSLEYLSLEDNTIHCSCGIICLVRKNVTIDGTCSTPTTLQNKPIESIGACNDTGSKSTGFLIPDLGHPLPVLDGKTKHVNAEKKKEDLENVTRMARRTVFEAGSNASAITESHGDSVTESQSQSELYNISVLHPTVTTENYGEIKSDIVTEATHNSGIATDIFGQPASDSVAEATYSRTNIVTESHDKLTPSSGTEATLGPTAVTESYHKLEKNNAPGTAFHLINFTESRGKPAETFGSENTSSLTGATESHHKPAQTRVTEATHDQTDAAESHHKPAQTRVTEATHDQTDTTESHHKPAQARVTEVTHDQTNATESHHKPGQTRVTEATHDQTDAAESHHKPGQTRVTEATHDQTDATESHHKPAQTRVTEATHDQTDATESHDEELVEKIPDQHKDTERTDKQESDLRHKSIIVTKRHDNEENEKGTKAARYAHNATMDQGQLEPSKGSVVTHKNGKIFQGNKSIESSNYPNGNNSHPCIHQEEDKHNPCPNHSTISTLETSAFNNQPMHIFNLSYSNTTREAEKINTKGLMSEKLMALPSNQNIRNDEEECCDPANRSIITSLITILIIVVSILAITCIVMINRSRGTYNIAMQEGKQQEEGKDIPMVENRLDIDKSLKATKQA